MDAQAAPVTGDTDWVNPRWEYPEYPTGSVVEIRVHGVGGEPPSGMTRDPNPRNVGGDDLAGFWRARNPEVAGLGAAGKGRRPHFREVLAWGGQTSGTFRHALWVLLLPFALFNIAGRMPGGPGRRAAVHRSVARLLAFTMTLGVVGLASGIAFDLLGDQYGSKAWRQVPAAAPPEGTGESTTTTTTTFETKSEGLLAPVKFFSDDGNDDEGTDDDPAGRMGFLALLPALVVLGLWLAGKYKTANLEGFPPDGEGVAVEPEELDDANFWRSEWPVSRLRAAHASGGLGLVGVTLCLILADAGPGHQERGWALLAALTGLAVVASAVAVALPATAKPQPDYWLRHLQWVTRLLALVPLTAAIVLATGTHLPPLPGWLSRSLQIAGIGAVAFWVVREVRGARDMRREGSDARADTGILLNLLVVAGTAVLAATLASVSDALNTGDVLTASGHVPASFAWIPHGVTAWMEGAARQLYLPAYAVLLPVVALQVVLVVALACTALRTTFPRRAGGNPAIGNAFPLNLGAVVVALLALLFITAVGGSLHGLMIEWLGRRTASAREGLVLPWWYAITAEVAALLLPALLLVALAIRKARAFLARRSGARQIEPADVYKEMGRGLEGAGKANPADPADTTRLVAIGKQWHDQALVRDATRLLAWAVLAAMTLVVAYFVAVGLVDGADLVLHAGDPEGAPCWVTFVQRSWLTSAAVWVLSAATVAAVGFLRSSLRNRASRRQVAVLWDVLAFWPRVTHPFAPPCYGEAVVPMLAGRIDKLVDGGHKVLVAGHSQGSVISLAAVMQMRSRTSVWLVSYGSPIAALYERCFPGTFAGDAGAIKAAEGRVTSWHHLFGMTEPFAVPFWDVPGASADDLRAGWPANLLVRHADGRCAVCGWPGPARKRPTVARTDFVVTDPAPWAPPLDPVVNQPKGHSTYHDHREVDEHLAQIVP